ncbi:MAG: FAD-dependent oxidoreductase [Cellvibrionaceae bacterium]|nr:FAD-dependent oxidoreductase [Cellvibrionaceae bacterium]
MSSNQSFWQHKYGRYQPNPPLPAGVHKVDVLIIGGGYTGLTTARELKRDAPELSVMLLDANDIGFGASGRNGGFNMTLFGMEPEVTVFRWGKNKATQAQSYMQDAVEYVRTLIDSEQLDSDYEHTGMWRVAYSAKQEKRLRKTFGLLQELGGNESYQLLSQSDAQQKLKSPRVRAAIYEPGTGILDPCKHVRELKRLAEQAQVNIFENSPVLDIEKLDGTNKVKTANAVVHAQKLVLATNAWSHTLQGSKKLRNRQRPVWTYQIVSDPLTAAEWESVGWQDRMSIEDNRQLVHYMRITKCGRITMGGGSIGIDVTEDMNKWHDAIIWEKLKAHFDWLFPALKHKKVHYQWGGAVSSNMDMTPEIGFLGDENIVYANGCIGHGVSLTQYNGRVIADLLLGKDTERSRFWIVNRKAIAVPPGKLLAWLGVNSINAALKTVDWYEERELNRSVSEGEEQ